MEKVIGNVHYTLSCVQYTTVYYIMYSVQYIVQCTLKQGCQQMPDSRGLSAHTLYWPRLTLNYLDIIIKWLFLLPFTLSKFIFWSIFFLLTNFNMHSRYRVGCRSALNKHLIMNIPAKSERQNETSSTTIITLIIL